MTTTIRGVVKDGLVVPSSPLPEGVLVEIRPDDAPPEISPELQAEFEAWDRSSAEALALVEGPAGGCEAPRIGRHGS